VRRRVAGLALAAIAAASPADAQRIRGVVTDAVTHERVPRGIVVLYDSAGRGLGRAIAAVDGAYSIAGAPAMRRLRVMRIGFRPRDITLSAGDSVLDVALQPIPPVMNAVQSNEARVCAADPDNSAIELWEQARAGLLASVIAQESSPPRMRVRTYRRVLDPVLKRPVADTIVFGDHMELRSFVAARPPWVFASYGYMRDNRDHREFYAPSEAVLLDPTFAETHCLRAIDGRGPRAGEVGIAFDPIVSPDRDTIVDVEGALWLDRSTYAPRTIEFRYTNLERDSRDAGGEVHFVLMPNGISMVERWQIRTTMLAFDEPSTPDALPKRDVPRRERRGGRILGYDPMGGEVVSAVWPDGKRWVNDLPHIEGTVADPAGEPVRDALVWLANRRDTVRTDSSGHFEFAPGPPGLYHVYASDSALATVGISRALPVEAIVLASQGAKLDLRLLPRAKIFPSICPARSYTPGTGVLMARVVDSLGVAVPLARVDIESTPKEETSPTATPTQTRTGVTGDDGRFIICGAQLDRRLVVRVYGRDSGAGVAIDRWGDEFLSLTLELRPLKP
jgi:hypothetical protein